MENHSKSAHRAAPHPVKPGTSTQRWLRSREEGTITVLALFVFVSMLLISGLAIDMVRVESARLQMQGTADRAALAAASLRETPDTGTPQQIVEAYFAAEGLHAQLGDRVLVEESEEDGRTVTVVPAATMPATFSRLLGIDSLDLATPARAQEAIAGATQIELVLVLDTSGSMNSQGKIGAMRDAAVALAEILLTDAEPEDVSITLVPYSAWVLPPANFLNSFSNVSGNGACNDWSIWNQVSNSLTLSTIRRGCATDAWRQVHAYQNDLTTVTSAINNLGANGTTSIDLGVRFGALFFDPSIRPAITDLITSGSVPPAFAGRPYDWDQENVVRAMLILTDGQNCCGARYSVTQQDANTESVCTELKQNGVLIYSIAFQAPARGAALMQACASSPSHYFNADVSEIVAAFQAIGSNIQTHALRLTL